MRPDLHIAMRRALALGPGHCPHGLFTGSIPAIVSGLKAHDSTIAGARHSALQYTFPRTRELIGSDPFDALVREYVERADVRRLPLNDLGRSFPEMLAGDTQFLARIEWAWLEAHGASDGRGLALADLAGMRAEAIAAMRVGLHPAARVAVAVGAAGPVEFDGATVHAPAALVTRPDGEVQVREASRNVVGLFLMLGEPLELGTLLEQDADAAAFLIQAGALALEGEASR